MATIDSLRRQPASSRTAARRRALLRTAGLAAAAALALLPALLGGEVTARFRNGWPEVTWKGTVLTRPGAGPAAVLVVGGQESGSEVRPTAGDGAQAAGETPFGPCADQLRPSPRFPLGFERRLRFTNATTGVVDVLQARLWLEPNADVSLPAWETQSFVMRQCGPHGPTLCLAFTSDEDGFRRAHDPARPARVGHEVESAWRLGPGQEAAIGTQYLWVVDGPLEQARRSAQSWYEAVGLTVADGGPDWFRDAILYQVSAGGSVDSRFGDVGGFANLERQLDYLADLGCNAFWLMSVHTHKQGGSPAPGWNLYHPLRYDQIDPAYGGEEGLDSLVEAMRRRGFRVLGEIVPHGGAAPAPAAHPEWWTYDRQGRRSRLFGQAPDYSCRAWQTEIAQSIESLTARWHFDGFRVDVAEGFGSNWSSPANAPHVSLSTLGGSLGMLRAIREGALRSGAASPAIIPETSREIPELARAGPIGYGQSLISFWDELSPAGLLPAELVERLSAFFAQEQFSLPRGMVLLRALNNHDTVVDRGRADRRFGVGLQQALMGVCTVVEGVPMLYQEQEVGSYERIRRLFWARRRVPEIARGTADYRSLRAPAGVFAVWRQTPAGQALGLVNVSSQPVTGAVVFPPAAQVGDGTRLFDAVSGRQARVRNGRFSWRWDPYETGILRVGRPPEGALPRERRILPVPEDASPRDRWEFARTPAGWRLRSGSVSGELTARDCVLDCSSDGQGRIRVHATGPRPDVGEVVLRWEGIDRWQVQSTVGTYADRSLRRHYPWTAGDFSWDPSEVWGYEPYHLYGGTLPPGRVWQAAVATLAPQGAIAWTDLTGAGWFARQVRTTAANLVLSEVSEGAERGGTMELRFLARDGALNPDWMPGYRRARWILRRDPAPTGPDAAFRASFVLVPIRQRDDIPPAPPLSGAERGESLALGPGEHRFAHERLWLVEPNTLVWNNIHIEIDADYQLALELRHSERSAREHELCGAYELRFQGAPVPLRWTGFDSWHTGNAFFGWAQASLGRLKPGDCSLSLRTQQAWCAVSRPLVLTRGEAAPR